MDDAQATYWLAGHVHLCVCGPHAVLMDLRRDRYVAVQPPHVLAGWVAGWPSAPLPAARHRRPDGLPAKRVRSLLAQLHEQGMLVMEERTGRSATPLGLAVAERSLLEFDFDRRVAVGGVEFGHFALAWLRARTALAVRPIHAIISAAEARKARAPPAASTADPPRERTLIEAFVHLRPLFYTVRRACLLDSLTLVHFLAAHDLYPEWVFGVRTAPFDAHCWVQRGELLFNDLPDRVRQYSPIFRV